MDSLLDIQQITNLLPHRYPFLLVDRVVEIEPNKSIKAYKNVTVNEPFFQGHFPGRPVMPGVLILEALAQAGCLMVLHPMEEEERERMIFVLTGIEKAKFRRSVFPGDRLELHCRLIRSKMRMQRMESFAYVDGQLVAEAQLTAAFIPKSGLQ